MPGPVQATRDMGPRAHSRIISNKLLDNPEATPIIASRYIVM
jgi:hypothetical protein